MSELVSSLMLTLLRCILDVMPVVFTRGLDYGRVLLLHVGWFTLVPRTLPSVCNQCFW